MKTSFTLALLLATVTFASAQKGGGGSGGSGSSGGSSSGFVTGSGGTGSGGSAPANSAPVGTAPAASRPVIGRPAGTAANSSPITSPGSQQPAGVGGGATVTAEGLIVNPDQGIQPADPIVPPITNAPGGAITNLLPDSLNQTELLDDPAGALRTNQVPQSATNNAAFFPERSGDFGTTSPDEGLSRQLGVSLDQNGATTMAFPDQNALITIVSQNGSLALQGTVTSEAQRRQIEDAIRRISPGTFIDNQIQLASAFFEDAE